MDQVLWDENSNPIGKSIEQVLYAIRTEDKDGLIYDAVTLDDVIKDSDGYLATFDALIAPYARLERRMLALIRVMNKAVPDYTVVDHQISKPYKYRGTVQVCVSLELSDGQVILIFFHNPDVDAKRIAPTDELVTWKWTINKRDVSIIVAPERGQDITVQQVGRRIMKLASKNTQAFQRANKNRAEKLKIISDYEKEIAELEKKLAGLLKEIELAKFEKEERELKALETPSLDALRTELIAKNWIVNANNDEILTKEIDAHRTVVNIKLLLNGTTLELVASGELGLIKTIPIKGGLDKLIRSINEESELLALQYADQTLMNRLIDAVKSKGHSVEVLAPLEIVVTTKRAGEKFEIGLDDDGDFTVESSSGMTVSHINGENDALALAKAIDDGDFVEAHSFEDDQEIDGSLIQGGVFKGKTYEFAQTIEAIETAVDRIPDLSVAFGNFNSTAQQNLLFDSVLSESSPPIYGITAQIGYKPTDIILARVYVDEKGDAKVYRGEGGTSYEGGSGPDASKFESIFKKMIADIQPEEKWEDSIPLVKEYLDRFTALRRGQVLKQLSKTAYNDEGVKQTVAENIIEFVQKKNSYVDVNNDGDTTVFADGFMLSKKLGRLAINFGIWLANDKNMATRLTQMDKDKTFTSSETGVLINAIQDHIHSYETAIRQYEKDDAVKALRNRVNQADVVLNANMESDDHRKELERILPRAKHIVNGDQGPTIYDYEAGDLLKSEGWSEIFKGNSTILTKNFDGIEVKVSILDNLLTLVADPVAKIEDRIELTGDNFLLTTAVDDKAKRLAKEKASFDEKQFNEAVGFNELIARIEANDVEYAKGLSIEEYERLFELLAERNYHTESHKLSDMRNAENVPTKEYSYFVVKQKLGQGTQSKNTGYIKPIIGSKFTDNELSEMLSLLEESVLINTSKIQNGLIYVQSNQYKEDIQDTVEGIIPLKLTKKEIKHMQDEEERRLMNEQRKLEIDKNLNKNDKTKEFIEKYFSSINDYNKEKMALFLNGDDETFKGMVNNSFISGAESLGVVIPELGEIDWDKLKQIFSNQKQPEPEPTPVPELTKPMAVDDFLNDLIAHPENHTSNESFSQLEAIINNPSDFDKDVVMKADKAIDVYNDYATEQIMKDLLSDQKLPNGA